MSSTTIRRNTTSASSGTVAVLPGCKSDNDYYVVYQLRDGQECDGEFSERYRSIRTQMEALGAVAWVVERL